MKKIIYFSFVCLIVLPVIGVPSIEEGFQDLKKMGITTKVDDFKALDALYQKNPSKKTFYDVVKFGKEWIKQEPDNCGPYMLLSSFYLLSNTLDSKHTAYIRALNVLDQFLEKKTSSEIGKKEIIDQKNHIKEMLTLLSLFSNLEKKEKKEKKNHPVRQSIKDARKLYKKYIMERKNKNPKLLNEAIEVLKEDLKKRPSNYEIYQELARLYLEKEDYMNTYMNWEIASTIGNTNTFILDNVASGLYNVAINYEVNNNLSKRFTGGNPKFYFLWLKKDEFLNSMSLRRRKSCEEGLKMLKKVRKKQMDELKKENPKLYDFIKNSWI